MPAFLTHAIADSRQACVSVDSEVCGINLAPESGSSAVENSELSNMGSAGAENSRCRGSALMQAWSSATDGLE